MNAFSPLRSLARAAAPMALLLVSGLASAAPVAITGVTGSSEYPADDSGSYEAKRAADGKLSTAWVEGEAGNGLGASLTLDFGGAKEVAKIRFWGGMWYSTEYWDRSSRPTEIELVWSDGSKELVSVANEMKFVEHKLAKPKSSTNVKIIVKSVKSGTTWSDTGISEVQVFDTAPDTSATVTAITASTTAKPDADGNYDPMNLVDRITDSMWCEGAGDGKGEWVEFQLGSKQTIGSLTLNNGIGTSLKFFMKGNRAAKATLQFGDGSSQQITVKNSMMPQTITFTPVTTDKVKLVIDEIAKGTEIDDLCLSEATFAK